MSLFAVGPPEAPRQVGSLFEPEDHHVPNPPSSVRYILYPLLFALVDTVNSHSGTWIPENATF